MSPTTRLGRLVRRLLDRVAAGGAAPASAIGEEPDEAPGRAWPVPQLPDLPDRHHAVGVVGPPTAVDPGATSTALLHPNRLAGTRIDELVVHTSAALPGGPWSGVGGPVGEPMLAALRALAASAGTTGVVADADAGLLATTGIDLAAVHAACAAPLEGGPPDADVDAGSASGGEDATGTAAVVVADEDQRSRVEQRAPELVGRVEVATAPRRPTVRVPASGPLRLGVVGYNLKFLRPVLDRLVAAGAVEVLVDEWPRFRSGPTSRTDEVVAAADVVLCEWCGPNAAHVARVRRPDQGVVVRLHRFELDDGAWRDVDVAGVDAVVTVGEGYRRRTLEETGWPAGLVTVVPNPVDVDHFDRPKLPGADRTLGLLGADRSRKRLDRALDLLATLRADDQSWQLRVKGVSPWDSGWVADRPDEVAWFATQRRRLDDEPLRSGVVLDPAGPDVAAWFRQVGFVLSPSDDESFHLAPAEGMASGTVPVLWPWPGVEDVYDPRWVVSDTAAAVERVRATAGAEWARAGDAARAELAARYGAEVVDQLLLDVLLGAADRARGG